MTLPQKELVWKYLYEHKAKYPFDQIAVIMKTLPDINKSKPTDDSNNEYEDKKVRKIKLSKDNDNDNDDITFVDKRPVHSKTDLRKLTLKIYLLKRRLNICVIDLDTELKQY